MSNDRDSEQMRWQIATHDYVDEVMQIARESPLHTTSRVDFANRELIVVGVGEPPAALADAIGRAPQNIRVTWQQAPHTLVELRAEIERIMSAGDRRLNSAWPLADGTGIGIATTDQALLDARDPRTTLGARYPVTIEYGGPARPV